MSTQFVCDWCGDVFEHRDAVASVDVTIGATSEQCHLCAVCAPDFLKQEFPEERYPENTEPIPDGGKALDTSPDIGERVTYYDSDGVAHRALVTWVFGDDPGAAPMINCARGADFDLGATDADGGDYGYKLAHETSVQHVESETDTHAYVRGWGL